MASRPRPRQRWRATRRTRRRCVGGSRSRQARSTGILANEMRAQTAEPARALKRKREHEISRVNDGDELDAPLDGEAGSIVQLDGYSAAAAVGVCCAAGKYLALFERPLLALGAFREARSRDGRCVAASHGMAQLLLDPPRRRRACVWLLRGGRRRATGGGGRRATDGLGGVLVRLPAAGAARVLPSARRRRPLPAAGRDKPPALPPQRRCFVGAIAVERPTLHLATRPPRQCEKATPRARQVTETYACAEAEPVLSKLRFALCTKLMRSLGAADAGDVDTVASLAIHCLHVGLRCPEGGGSLDHAGGSWSGSTSRAYRSGDSGGSCIVLRGAASRYTVVWTSS